MTVEMASHFHLINYEFNHSSPFEIQIQRESICVNGLCFFNFLASQLSPHLIPNTISIAEGRDTQALSILKHKSRYLSRGVVTH